MFHLIHIAAFLVASVASAQEPRAIFDGKSLDGFDGRSPYWSVDGGELVGRSTKENPLPGSTWLIWRGGLLADFRLDLDFKLIGGNSGVQFRSVEVGPWRVGGYQADLEDGPDWSGCLYEQEGRGVCARRGEAVRFEVDGKKSVQQVADGAKLLEKIRVHQWNHYTIVARGTSISLSINDVLMTTVVDLDTGYSATQGLLAFQLHEGPPMEVRFKNIELTEYAPAVPIVAPAVDVDRPQWIWTKKGASDDKEAYFQKAFELASAPKSARLAGSADNQFEVFVNGARVLDHDDWEKPVFVDVAKHLLAGKNDVVIHAHNDTPSPAGVQCALDIELEGGTKQRIVTDASWSGSEPREGEHSDWKPAVVIGALGTGVWGRLPEPVAWVPAQALAAEELKVPEGFKAELLYSVPRRTQGSWVSMCFDDRRRIIASDQYGPLYRVTLENGAVKFAEELDVPLGKAQGLCWAFDALYVVVSLEDDGYEPGLWRAKHRADDTFEKPELLKKFDGNGEHGPHAVVLAPDKKSLFVVGGNHTKPPEPLAKSYVPKCWGEDQLLPQHADPNGHAVGITAPGGWICQTDPDGKEWTLFACGFRNTYDMAFDADGEAFTFDSDMEWDMGLPWYRPTMIEHVVPGGDYGWRTGSWRWPAYYPDSLPGVVDIGASSPTGVCFAPEKFVTPNGGRLLVGDWAYGKIISVALTPSGASYRGSFETLVEGKPMPVTDMEFGPDGALYFLVGGRRTQSGVYRITREPARPISREQVRLSPAETEARALRSKARAFVESDDPNMIEVFDALDSNDRFLRYSARVALDQRTARGAWYARALGERRPRASTESLIATAHVLRDPLEFSVELGSFQALPIETMDEEQLLAALRALELILLRHCTHLEAHFAERLVARLDLLYPNASNFANRELCQLLVYLESPTVVAKTLALIDSAKTQEDQIAFAWSLRCMKSHWTIEQRVRFFRWMNETTAGWSGGLSFTKYLDNLREDAVATLSDEERRLLAGMLDKPRTALSSEEFKARKLVQRWTIDDLLPVAANARKDRDFERGERTYREARCIECHRIAKSGGGSGPDLTGAGNRFGDRDLLEAMLDPSKTISDQYQDTEILTEDDELFIGRLERRPNGDVRLWQTDGKEPIEIPAAKISRQRPYAHSRMPSGLLDSFEKEELTDLIAYLRSGANSKDAAFKQEDH